MEAPNCKFGGGARKPQIIPWIWIILLLFLSDLVVLQDQVTGSSGANIGQTDIIPTNSLVAIGGGGQTLKLPV